MTGYDSFQIFKTRVDSITVDELHQEMAEIIAKNGKEIVANVNVYALNLAYKNLWFREFLNNSKIVFCDGAGVMLAARFLGQHIPERITYADWMWQLAEFAESKEFSFYFLGSKNGVTERAAKNLKARFPKLQIIGSHHGYFDKSPGSPENLALIEEINQLKPDILIIGFGMPLQERWIMDNWEKINVNIVLNGGAVFDYVSGELARGPKWMTDNGMEWLARLIIEPKRLWKRYILGNPLFLWRVMKQKIGILPD